MGGIVSTAGEVACFECMIRDITDTGARLFARGRRFPDEFHLIHVRNKTFHTARVAWRREPEVGVAFSDSFPIAEIKDPALSHLARLWLMHARA